MTVEGNPSSAELAGSRERPALRPRGIIRWSRWSPQIALVPATAITLVAFIGAIGWTIWLSFTRSRRFPEYGIDWSEWDRQYNRLFRDDGWQIALKNLVVLGIGSTLAIVFGFILAALIDREKRGEGIFRTDSSSSTARITNSQLRNTGSMCIGPWRSCTGSGNTSF